MGNSERASHDLLKCATPHASEATMTELERTVLNYYPTWELNKGNAQARGQAQLKLLAGVADSRLTPAMRNRLQELRRKLPDLVPDDATVFFGGEVVSPIPKAAAERMSDAQWLKAMEKYSSDETRNWHPDHAIGGSSELSRVLAEETKRDPARFATLALSMPDSVHRDYFEAIVMGMGEAEADLASVLVVCQRCHALPGRPNGRWIARLIARHAERDLPEEALELVSWYALSDPDPAEESWRKTAVGGGTYYGGDILTAGLNTVRGSAGDAIGTLLFPKVERLSFFEPVLERMVDDPSIAVRSQVAKALIAVLKYDRDLAVRLFLRLCDTEEDLLGTYFVEQFLRYALTTHFDQLEPIVKRMLVSQNTQVGRVGARRACIAAFNNDRAQPLADQAMGGSQFLRLGAAEVYATNLGHGDLQRVCEAALHTLFQDDDDEVRKAAARCFGNLSDEDVERLGGLIQAFIESPAFDSDHHLLLHTLNEGSARVPDVVLSVCERFFTVSGEAARDIQRPAFGEAQIISELVARIYGQQLNASYQDSAMIDRCLDLIDEMCMLRIYGLEKLLEVQDR